ncbi:hypothetical protein VPH35_137556 [Triticum aestivum]
MSYRGSPGASPVPSPMVPLMVVLAFGWVICNETLMEWYVQVTDVQETVTDNTLIFILASVVLVPTVLVLVMLLIQNIVVAAFLLLLAVYFAGIYYYPPHRGYGGSGNLTNPDDDWTGSGLGFYLLLLLCLVLCPMVLLAACLLCLNLFAGGKVLGYEYI